MKYRFQTGGDSTDFFTTLADYAQQQQSGPSAPPDTSISETTQDETDSQDVNYSEDDYNDLNDKYNDLSNEYESLKRGMGMQQNYEDQFLNFLFSDESKTPVLFDNEELYPSRTGTQQPVTYNGEIISSGTFKDKNIGTYGKQIYGDVASYLGYAPVANSIYRDKALNDKLIREGKPAVRNSYHLSGNAVDFKPSDWNKLSKQQQASIKSKYDVIYHDNHYHVEPKGKMQTGGVANTPEELYNGLNGSDLKEMILNLPKQYNLIRGLDSGQPVHIQDEQGNQDVLYGPQHTAKMYGKVQERKLSIPSLPSNRGWSVNPLLDYDEKPILGVSANRTGKKVDINADYMQGRFNVGANIHFQAGGLNIDSTLSANKHIPFVDRIINADKYPVRKNLDGSVSTHLMSYADNIAFPSLRYVNGKWLDNVTPEQAVQSGDYISFKNEVDAAYFAKNYKNSKLSKIKK